MNRRFDDAREAADRFPFLASSVPENSPSDACHGAALALREKDLKGMTKNFISLIAEHELGLRVKYHDVTLCVDDDLRIGGCLDDLEVNILDRFITTRHLLRDIDRRLGGVISERARIEFRPIPTHSNAPIVNRPEAGRGL